MRLIRLVLLIFLFFPVSIANAIVVGQSFELPAGGGSAPTINGSVTAVGAGSTRSTLTVSNHTVDAGTDLLIYAFIGEDQASPADTPASCTWNTSESMTHYTSADSVEGQNEIAVWYLVNPTATTADISCPADSDHDGFYFGDISVAINIDGGDTISAYAVNSATSTDTVTAAITSTADNALILTFIGIGEAVTLDTYGSGQTEIAEESIPTETGGASSETKATAGSDTQSVVVSASANRLVMSTIAINPM